MEAAADAVADKFADDGETVGLGEFFDGATEVGQATTRTGVTDGFEQGLFGDGEQALGFERDVAGGHGGGVVADESAFHDADVDFHDIAGLDLAGAADAVDDFFVDGDAGVAGKAAVAEEGAFAVVLAHEVGGVLVDLAGGAARGDFFGQCLKDGRGNGASVAHEVDFTRRLDRDTSFAGHEVVTEVEK